MRHAQPVLQCGRRSVVVERGVGVPHAGVERAQARSVVDVPAAYPPRLGRAAAPQRASHGGGAPPKACRVAARPPARPSARPSARPPATAALVVVVAVPSGAAVVSAMGRLSDQATAASVAGQGGEAVGQRGGDGGQPLRLGLGAHLRFDGLRLVVASHGGGIRDAEHRARPRDRVNVRSVVVVVRIDAAPDGTAC